MRARRGFPRIPMTAVGAALACVFAPSNAVAAPPLNDDCANATVIAVVPFADLAVDITLATDDANVDASCDLCFGGSANNGVWWTYTPPVDCVAVISVTGTGTVTSLFAGSDCANLTQIECVNTTSQTMVSTDALVAGVQHWILVSVSGLCSAEPTGPIDFSFDCIPSPPNDDCINAEPLGPLPTTVTVDTTTATDDPVSLPFCGISSINRPVWYSVTGTGNTITATTCNAGGNFDDTKIQVWCGDCEAPICVVGNQFDFDCVPLARATASWCSQAGVTYLIAVGGDFPDAGLIQLDVFDDGTPCGNPPVACPSPGGNCQVGDPSLVDRSNRAGNVVADDFTPAGNGSITDISWWGVYIDSGFLDDCQGSAPDTFEVRYYADDGEGVPGALIGGPFAQAGGTLAVAGPVATGGTVQGPLGPIPEFEFTATHAPVPVAAGQCYWIEITNMPSATCEWFWEVSLAGNGRGMMDGQLLNGTLFIPPDGFDPGDELVTVIGFPADHAFCVNLPLADPTICLPPPAMNDDCANAKPIAGEGVFAFDNSTATTDGPPHAVCGFAFNDNVNSDVWFCWTAPCSLVVSVETCDRTCINTRIAVYDGCVCPPSDANLLACNDEGCPANPATCTGGQAESFLTFTAVAGQTYLIRVGGQFSNSQGTGTFKIRCIPPLPTPICEQPLENCQDRNVDSVITSDLTHFIAADDFTPTTTGTITDICWWGIYATGIPSPDTFIIRYYTNATGIPGTLIAVFKQPSTLTVNGPANTGLLVGGSDPEFEYTAAHAPVSVTAGQCYWIEISNPTDGSQSWFWELSRAGIGTADQSLWSVQDGTPGCGTAGIPPDGFDFGDRRNLDLAFCVNLPLGDPTQCTPPQITNDDCSIAAQISGEGAFPFDIGAATLDGPPHAACVLSGSLNDQINQDVWACWTATCSGDVLVDTCGLTAADTKIAVYDGCACPVTDARLLACNDESCGQSQSRVGFTAVAGQQYLIRLGSDFCFDACDGFFSITCAPVPVNDQCAAAIGPLAVPSSTTGSTKYATIDSGVAFGCGNAGIASPGVWYTVTGTGNTMTASLCNEADEATRFCTRLSVFCGDCNGLTCIAGAGIPVCAGQSELSWCSQAGVTYFILVHGDDFILDTGPFELELTDNGIACGNPINCLSNVGACCTNLFANCSTTTEQDCLAMGGDYSGDGSTCPCPTNDFCADALGPLAVPSVTVGTTDSPNVTVFDESSFPNCGSATTSGQSWGVWYTVTGTGTTITASLCNPATTFDTQLSIYCGDCDNPICVDGNDNFCPPTFGGQSQVSWCAEAGRTYFILVHGGLFATGSFELELSEDGIACPSGCPPPPPVNDECAGAFGPLAVPSTTMGTTDRAAVDSSAPFCGTGITAPGVWYAVVGTGNTMTATTCAGIFDFDTKLSVYCGDCVSLICVDGNDDDCSGGASIRLSTVTWCSQAGTTYFILVHGFSSGAGDFELAISDDSTACTPTVQCSCSGGDPDIDGDGDVDEADQALFVQVLLGIDTGDPLHVVRSDLNNDCSANGNDIQAFVIARLGP